MSTKNLVVQEILTYEGLYRLTKMMGLFSDGLKCNGVLKLVRGFPEQFVSLFTYTGLSAEDVLDSVCSVRCAPRDEVMLSFFQQYIRSCTEYGK